MTSAASSKKIPPVEIHAPSNNTGFSMHTTVNLVKLHGAHARPEKPLRGLEDYESRPRGNIPMISSLRNEVKMVNLPKSP